ncbi:MAG: helix-turn-helix transcriptional regulator [Clostridia bacterium]|nr:helix-turn-helix transcriptional regulator [Clostridia bacterium]
MPNLELYEKKVLNDEELPIQLAHNRHTVCGEIFGSHWHEHIEMHYVFSGSAVFHIDQELYEVQEGDLIIANRNELHAGYSIAVPYDASLLVFDPSDLSWELGEKNLRFQSLIRGDTTVRRMMLDIFYAWQQEELGYRALCRAKVTELLVYLCRHYAVENLPAKDLLKRRRNLERLRPALEYIEQNYSERISVNQLAQLLCLSPDRLGHLFRDGVGQAPLQYINEIRLRKAMNLLKTEEYTVTEVAQTVGFFDYNHFGRLFRRRYGCTPNQVRQGKAGNNL